MRSESGKPGNGWQLAGVGLLAGAMLLAGVQSWAAQAQSSQVLAESHGESATAACFVHPDGTLEVVALGYGAGYMSAPRVALRNVPAGATATVVADAPIDGEIRSYTVKGSAGWPQTISYGQICPAVLTVDGPTAGGSEVAGRMAAAMPGARVVGIAVPEAHATRLPETIRVDDYGAKGDGVSDDRRAIQAAMDAASWLAGSSPGSNPKVSFTAGKSYFVGSIGGFYWGAFDDGSVPVAAELECRASGGVVRGCSVVSGGYALRAGATPIVPSAGTNGSGVAIHPELSACVPERCAHNEGEYVSGAEAAGGTGYPEAFRVYVGPTCGGVPCRYLAPETPARIGYGVELPNNVTIEGNGASVTGGYVGPAAGAASYGNDFPYIATFANVHGGNDIIRNLTFMNAFIGVGNVGAFMDFENDSFQTAIAVQGEQAQFVIMHNINYNCVCAGRAGVVVGGQWGTRSPAFGLEGGEIANSLNIADGMHITNMNFFQGYATPTNQKALDCWFDRNFFHLEDQGIHNALECYEPPGGVVRMTDQDEAAQQEPDDLWRGIFGIPVAIYTRYGRPTNNPVVKNLQAKHNLSYGLVAGPHINAGIVETMGFEGSGECEGGAIYGSAECPNPYEPFAKKPLGVILTDSQMEIRDQGVVAPYEAVLTYPWQTPPPMLPTSGITHLAHSAATPELSEPEAVPGNRGREFRPQLTWLGAGQRLNADSEFAEFEGNRYTSQMSLDEWAVFVHDQFQPRNYPSILELDAQTGKQPGQSYVKANGLAVDSAEVQNGQVTGLEIVDGGSGYGSYAHVGCRIAPSTNQEVTIGGTQTPFEASCYGVTDASGKVTRLYLAQPGLGYLSEPMVTLDTPSAGGRQARARATIVRMQSYIPVGHLVIDSFYLPSAGVVAANSSVTLSDLPCPDASGIRSAAPTMQDQVSVISMGSQTWGVPGVIVTALAMGSGKCSVTLNNPTATAMPYGAGTAREPWELLIVGAGSGAQQAAGFGPQGILASGARTTVSSAAGGNLAATTGAIGGGRLALGCTTLGRLKVPGATALMACVMGGAGGNPAGVMPECAVTGPDEVEVELCVAATTTAGAQRYNVRVLR